MSGICISFNYLLYNLQIQFVCSLNLYKILFFSKFLMSIHKSHTKCHYLFIVACNLVSQNGVKFGFLNLIYYFLSDNIIPQKRLISVQSVHFVLLVVCILHWHTSKCFCNICLYFISKSNKAIKLPRFP